jgi:hypothetical protein
MRPKTKRGRLARGAKAKLGLPDLEHAKAAVLVSLWSLALKINHNHDLKP